MNEEILDKLVASAQKTKFIVHFPGKSVSLSDCLIQKTETPVNRPTRRGGVYFSDKYVYKLVGTTDDIEIVPLLSKVMLGPQNEFVTLKIDSDFQVNSKKICLYGHITNTVQTSSKIVLHVVIDKIT